MIWRVPESPPDPDLLPDHTPDPDLPPDLPPDLSLVSMSLTSASTQSPGSAPGSGMALDSNSDSETETIALSSRSPSVPEAQDPVSWSAEVEEMLSNPPPGKFESFNLSGDPSMSSWVVPNTRETQNSHRGCIPSISPVTEIDEASPRPPSHSPSPFLLPSIEPLEDFTGHLAGET